MITVRLALVAITSFALLLQLNLKFCVTSTADFCKARCPRSWTGPNFMSNFPRINVSTATEILVHLMGPTGGLIPQLTRGQINSLLLYQAVEATAGISKQQTSEMHAAAGTSVHDQLPSTHTKTLPLTQMHTVEPNGI